MRGVTTLRREPRVRRGLVRAVEAAGASPTGPGASVAGGEDPRIVELRRAVTRLRRKLATHPAELSDRAVAEEELAALAAMAEAGVPHVPRLRRSLLLVLGAVGSVSALQSALDAVRNAVELFGTPPPRPEVGGWPAVSGRAPEGGDGTVGGVGGVLGAAPTTVTRFGFRRPGADGVR